MILLTIACDTCPARREEYPVEAEHGEIEVGAWATYQAEQAGWINLGRGQWRCRECRRIAKTISLIAVPIHAPAKKSPKAWPTRLVTG